MHPFNYMAHLKEKGQLPELKPGHSDSEMYDRTTEFEARKPAKKK